MNPIPQRTDPDQTPSSFAGVFLEKVAAMTLATTRTACGTIKTNYIGRTARLSDERQRELACAAASGDLDARDLLVRSNLGLVYTIARHFLGRGLALDDLAGEGNLGLIRAAKEFEPKFKVRFGTYAGYWIRQAILEALGNTARTIRIPAHMVQALRKWRRAESALETELGVQATFEEVADRIHLSASQRELLDKALRTRCFASMRQLEGAAPAIDDLSDPREGPAIATERHDDARDLRKRMAERLVPREQLILKLRFGLETGEPMTLKEVGAKLKMAREWVRKLEVRAVAKLRD